jgi:hypothetical protein
MRHDLDARARADRHVVLVRRRYDDVIVWVNKALDRDPQHLFAREMLGSAFWRTGDLERALELLSSAAALQPELGNEGFWRLAVAAETGDLEAAFEHLHRLDRRARPCVGSSRRGASVGQLARGSAVRPVPRRDELAAGLDGPVWLKGHETAPGGGLRAP